MSVSQKNRRRNYFIDKDFQTKFMMKFCVVIICASVLSAALIYYYNQQTTTVAFEDLRVTVKTTSDFILPIVLQILSIVTLIAGFTTVVVTLFASHKIAGPLYKLKIELEKMKAGDLTSPVRIRSTDQLQRVAADFDELRLNLSKSMKNIKDQVECLRAISETVDDSQFQESVHELDQEIKKYTI